MDTDERLDRLEQHCGLKPAGPVSLGEWRGWKMEWYAPTARILIGKDGKGRGWKPSDSTDWPQMMRGFEPEYINALLTAMRRAVERGLAKWPVGWEWADEPISSFWGDGPYNSGYVWLGTTFGKPRPSVTWPGDASIAATERAAMLGLCETKPAPTVEEQLIASLRSRLDAVSTEVLAKDKELTELRKRIHYIDGMMIAAIAKHGLATPTEGYDKAGWNWLVYGIDQLAKHEGVK